MKFEECMREYERLTRMGRKPPEKPDARLLGLAKNMQPWLWSEGVEEHIKWAKGYNILNSTSNYGGQFVIQRKLLLMQAEALLRNLDRLAEGKEMLLPLQSYDLEKVLEKILSSIPRHHIKGYVSTTAVRSISNLRRSDGIPKPQADLDKEDGSVCLEWREDEKVANLFIDTKGKFHLITNYPCMKIIDIEGGYDLGDRLCKILSEVTDWIYYKGSTPSIFD
jgi:hypothetical protein